VVWANDAVLGTARPLFDGASTTTPARTIRSFLRILPRVSARRGTAEREDAQAAQHDEDPEAAQPRDAVRLTRPPKVASSLVDSDVYTYSSDAPIGGALYVRAPLSRRQPNEIAGQEPPAS
jgi:hypothetical protein